jgi:peptide-methionine (R)-S-oxide reductase
MTDNQQPIQKSNSQWSEELTPEQYHILREGGTEIPFTGEYVDNHADGTYS